jgi:HAE1 family hydrophobic/amphiphilic exporter-1
VWLLTSVPLYRAVMQEFIPTNVDEAEFEVSVNGRKAPTSRDEQVITALEKGHSRDAGRGWCSLQSVQFSRGFNPGRRTCAIAPHEDRTLSFSKLWTETKKGNPLNVFKGNYTHRT